MLIVYKKLCIISCACYIPLALWYLISIPAVNRSEIPKARWSAARFWCVRSCPSLLRFRALCPSRVHRGPFERLFFFYMELYRQGHFLRPLPPPSRSFVGAGALIFAAQKSIYCVGGFGKIFDFEKRIWNRITKYCIGSSSEDHKILILRIWITKEPEHNI